MNIFQMMQFINSFKNQNPNEQINKLLSSGQVNQDAVRRNNNVIFKYEKKVLDRRSLHNRQYEVTSCL